MAMGTGHPLEMQESSGIEQGQWSPSTGTCTPWIIVKHHKISSMSWRVFFFFFFFNHNSNQGLRAESEAQWVEGLPNTRRALSFTSSIVKTECGATYNASIQEVKAEGSEVQGQPGL